MIFSFSIQINFLILNNLYSIFQIFFELITFYSRLNQNTFGIKTRLVDGTIEGE